MQRESHDHKPGSFTNVLRASTYTVKLKSMKFLPGISKTALQRWIFSILILLMCLPVVVQQLPTKHQNVRKIIDFACSVNEAFVIFLHSLVQKVKELQINYTIIEITKSFMEKCSYFAWLLCPNKCWHIKGILVYWQSSFPWKVNNVTFL